VTPRQPVGRHFDPRRRIASMKSRSTWTRLAAKMCLTMAVRANGDEVVYGVRTTLGYSDNVMGF
jgi:hypothetical protein